MKSKEKEYEKRARLGIEKLGGLMLKISSQYYTGLPDRLALLKGGVMDWVEFKNDGLGPTKIQDHVHGLLRGLGQRVWVVNSEESLADFLHYAKSIK